MKNLKNERGAITLIVLVTMLFLITFLISSYAIIANRAQIEAEATEAIRGIYEKNNNPTDLSNLYASYIGGNAIPIYSADQLIMIGSNQYVVVKKIGQGGDFEYSKYHYFGVNSGNNEYSYILMDNIVFDVDDYATELNNGNWTPLGDIPNIYYEGNGKTITVTKLDNTTVTYSHSNGYSD